MVILNCNGWRDTEKCLKSFFKQTYDNYHILLIDNGSHNESVAKLSKIKHKKLTFIQEPVNLGFAGGVNIGIRRSIEEKYDYVMLLNNDAQAEPDWLEVMIKTFKDHPDIGASTGLLLTADGKRIDGAGDTFSKWGIPALRLNEEPRRLAPESGYVFGATGGATLYRTDLFREIGLYDEKYFAYDEDVDISFRTQLAGYKIWYEKSAIAYHKHSATAKKMPGLITKQLFRNLPMLFIKNMPFPLTISVGFRFFLLYWLFLPYVTLKGDFKYAIKGLFASVTLWPHAFRERRRIQKSKKVDYKYIKSIMYPKIPLRSVRKIEEVFRVKINRKNRS